MEGDGLAEQCPSVVRLRGMPWSVSTEEVVAFLEGCNVVDVHFTFVRDGRPSGEAYVDLYTEEDVERALAKNQEHMGKRYIEVFRATREEMNYVISKNGMLSGPMSAGNVGGRGAAFSGAEAEDKDAVVRLRGLPFHCTPEDIMKFFGGLQILPNGISQLTDEMGRQSGEAYVQFALSAHADQALLKNKEMMGHRYIEVFRSSVYEACNAMTLAQGSGYGMGSGGGGRGRGARPSPYDRQGMGRGGGLRGGMRGARGSGLMGMSRGGGNIKGLMSGFNSGNGNFGSFGGGSSFGGSLGFASLGEYEEESEDYGTGGMGMGYGSGSMGFGSSFGRGALRGGRGFQRGSGGLGMGGLRGHGGGGRGMGGGGFRGGRGALKTPMIGANFVSETGHSVHMRGLPFSATADDIYSFFLPLTAMNAVFDYGEDGRPSGEADVDFSSHAEAEMAMKKNRATLGTRYIELFLNSTTDYSELSNADYGSGYLSLTSF